MFSNEFDMDPWRQFVTCLELRINFWQYAIAALEYTLLFDITKLHSPHIFQSHAWLRQDKSKDCLYVEQIVPSNEVALSQKKYILCMIKQYSV